jgi:hypothetical protein
VGMSAITFISDLPKDECLRRLLAQTRQGFWTRWAEGTISARVRVDRFRLFAWGPVNVHNSFAPIFYGRLEEVESKTRIHGRFRMHTLVQAFLFVWFSGFGWRRFAAIPARLSMGVWSPASCNCLAQNCP